VRDDLLPRQRQLIELELTATARTGPPRPGEGDEAYSQRTRETLRHLIEREFMGGAGEGAEDEADRPSDDEDEPENALPSAEWLSAWRVARDSLATYCHTRSSSHLETFNRHVAVMHELDGSRTIEEVRRMVDEIRPEWDPSEPVQPDLLRSKR
jgi:hypothetical protein